jgi:aspartyl-tRNA(Asn)/glutamyl-tRNA(Gln) amidotransferase subunit A
MYLEDIFTCPASLAGVCGISIPMGQSEDEQLPIGAQLLGPQGKEERLLQIAHNIQNAVNS